MHLARKQSRWQRKSLLAISRLVGLDRWSMRRFACADDSEELQSNVIGRGLRNPLKHCMHERFDARHAAATWPGRSHRRATKAAGAACVT
jgi:hypothetical protein